MRDAELCSGFFVHNESKARSFTHFAVRGERSTGTHYLDALIRQHTDILPLDTGWKHGFSFAESQPLHSQLLLVCIVRDWRTWVASMFRKPWHAAREVHALDFSAFIRAEWQGFNLKGDAANGQPAQQLFLQADRHPISGKPFQNLLDLRNIKHEFLFGLPDRHHAVMLMKYEWLVGNEAEFLAVLRTCFNVQAKEFRPIKHRFASSYGSFQQIQRPKLPPKISVADEDFILSQIDHGIERKLGYL